MWRPQRPHREQQERHHRAGDDRRRSEQEGHQQRAGGAASRGGGPVSRRGLPQRRRTDSQARPSGSGTGDGLLRARASERRILGAVRSVRDSRLPLLADLEIFSLCMRAQHWEALD